MKRPDDKKPGAGPAPPMAKRGVTRPMALSHIDQEFGQHQESAQQEDTEDQDSQGNGHDHSKDEHSGHGHGSQEPMLRMHHKQTLWVYWTLIMIGLWLVLNPLTFSYSQGTVEPSGGRSLWLTLDQRAMAMTWSDIISGLLLMVFGWRALRPNRPISLWICCFVGGWLTMAPVLFWSPTAAGFLNGSFLGMLVIGLTILIPGMPNMILFMAHGTTVPKGWSYNPSSWPQRWIMIATGLLGYFASRYLAAYQMGYVGFAWDPFFGDGTRQVLNSSMSHSVPISDAALGTVAYTFEFLMGFMGSPQRWRTMPWMVTFFGILVIPLGLVHIFLVMSQPVVVGHWCTFCLLAALIMIPMIPLEVDEVIAMGQFLVQAKRKGHNLWTAFWMGGSVEGEGDDNRTPPLAELPANPGKVVSASIWGMSFPWTLTLSAAIGLGIMFVPALLGKTGIAANADHIGGAFIFTVAVLAMGEVIRTVRWLNLLAGLAVAVTPWFTGTAGLEAIAASTLLGLFAAAAAIPRGQIRERYGEWNRFIV